VANRARDRLRADKRRTAKARTCEAATGQTSSPEDGLICADQTRQVNEALAQIPYEQREVIVLRIKADMKYQQIAKIQGVTYGAVQARYRRGIEQLRSILNGRLCHEADRENRTSHQQCRL
jgi:RNA polymerase sigma-70 factor (ECF subfamily)